MTTIYWPARLPERPLRASYKRGTANNTLRVSPEYGPAKTRRRTSANVRDLACAYALQEEKRFPDGGVFNQKRIFLDFYEVVDTSSSFWLPNPENPDEYILVRLKPSSETAGVELTPLAYRLWSVTLQLEVWPNVPAQPRGA